MCLAEAWCFYALGHSAGIQAAEVYLGWKYGSVSRVQLPKCTLGGNRKQNQLTFRAFQSQVTS